MKHLAIIADGNRRWATGRDLPPGSGHVSGLATIERTCEWAIDRGIKYLSVFCFSTENWNREEAEIDNLMGIARVYFNDAAEWYINRGIRVIFSGSRDRMPADILASMDTLKDLTSDGENLTLVIYVNHGGRAAIANASKFGHTEERLNDILSEGRPDPDVIFRTGGRHRLSNFMLWQAAYAELYFSDTLFPDLGRAELDELYRSYKSITKNYGR